VSAGRLNARFKLERQTGGTANGLGGKVKAWTELAAEVHGELVSLPGNEVTLAARLASREPAEIVMRRSPVTEGLTSADRMVEIGSGRVWDIRSHRPHPRRKGYLIFTAESSGRPPAG
jgi:head-tail adaptor